MEDLLYQYANFVEKNLNFLMQEDESVVLMGLEYIMNTIQTVMFVRVVRLKKLVAIMRLVLASG